MSRIWDFLKKGGRGGSHGELGIYIIRNIHAEYLAGADLLLAK